MKLLAWAAPFLVLAGCAACAIRRRQIAAMEADIDRDGKWLREHLGLEGGDT